MPYRIDCKEPPTDGDAFTLEANIKKKYKIVSVGGCPGDTSNFTKACQRLVDLAKLSKEIILVRRDNNVIVDSVSLPDIKE